MEIEPLYSCFLRSSGVNTDSRTLQPGQLFWALKGPNFNGNSFARKALEMGAAFVVVDEDVLPGEKRALKVSDSLIQLQKLAHYHRLIWGKEIIGVCGSNGKTTTKELIYRVLSTEKSVFATPGNLNNHIGVPLSLLQLKDEHEMAIIEMGANHRKEIEDLCYIAEPNSGLITNIGKDHLEGFGNIEGCAKANGELFEFLKNHLGIGFINTSDEWNLKLKSKLSRTFTFPSATDDFQCEAVAGSFFLRIKVPGLDEVETKLTGAYNFNNLATALAVGKYYGINSEAALKAVAEYAPSNNRSQVIQTKENWVISDAYNANPSSMMAALENLKQVKTKSKIAILGDMLELGKSSENEHKLLGEWASNQPDITFFVVGPEMKAFSKSHADAHYFERKGELESHLMKNGITGATVLLKASRGMKLESLLPLL
jgi:UDP-N-acetylmuramoyl-tripeptide--D-alanyl-D-alanine ligase